MAQPNPLTTPPPGADTQVVPGQLILLADPIVESLNALGTAERASFLADMALVGDALLAVTGCARVNYDILGNTDPALHAHVVPRYSDEPEERRRMPIWLYDWSVAESFAEERHGALRLRLAAELGRLASTEG